MVLNIRDECLTATFEVLNIAAKALNIADECLAAKLGGLKYCRPVLGDNSIAP
jgi:hypothetical protein